MNTHRIALVGAGTMGANHARVIDASPRATLAVVIDIDKERAKLLADQHGAAPSTRIEAANSCDAVIIASSTASHTDLALPMIERGLPVLVEKPLALTMDEVEILCNAALENDTVLTCGFVERFNAVVNQAMTLLDETPIHVVTMRHSPVSPRVAGSVVYDVLIHDIDLVLRLMEGHETSSVHGTSWRPKNGDCAEIADCVLQFSHGGLATLSASRAGQRKVRSMQVYTGTMMLDLDLLRANVTVYRNVRLEQSDVANSLTYRSETIIEIPFVRHVAEPLALELDHFLDLVEGTADRTTEVKGLVRPHAVADQIERSCNAFGVTAQE